MTAISVSERLLEMAAFYTPLALTVTAKQKKPVHRVEMTEGKRNIIRQLLEEYDIHSKWKS